MRNEVNWPQDEPVPQSMEEALVLGWELDSENVESSDDERTRSGTAVITKDVGLCMLKMTVPLKAEYTFGVPANPRAVLNDDELELRAARNGEVPEGRALRVH